MWPFKKPKSIIIKEKEAELESDRLKKEAETLKIKAEASKIDTEEYNLKQEVIIKRLEARSKVKGERNMAILCKMRILSDIMATTYSQDNNLGSSNRVFDDNDLLPYKGKMLELLKQL